MVDLGGNCQVQAIEQADHVTDLRSFWLVILGREVMSQPGAEEDYLIEYLSHAPGSLALIRAIECRKLKALEFKRPILDVGCGDGLFSSILFDDGVEVGLDYSVKELRAAARRDVYRLLMCADVARLPFTDRSFATVFSNGVLEHVRDLAGGLGEVARVLQPGGRLIMTVPTMESELQLGGAALLRRLGLGSLAQRYADTYNRLFAQVNVFSLETWRKHLMEGGLKLISWQYYGPPGAFRWHDLMMPLSLPNYVYKRLTGQWSALTRLRRVTVAPLGSALLRKLYLDETGGSSLLMVAERLTEASLAAPRSRQHTCSEDCA